MVNLTYLKSKVKVKSSMAMEESCKEESATTVCWVNYKLLEVMLLKDPNGNSDLQSTTASYGQCSQIQSIQLISIS